MTYYKHPLDQSNPSICDLYRIKRVEFGLLSKDEIMKLGENEITNPNIYDVYGKANMNGLNDPHFGTINRQTRCFTCGCDYKDCPGHFGFLKLAQPMFHIGYYEKVIKVLRCVCIKCSKLLVDSSEEKYRMGISIKNPQKRLAYFSKLCQSIPKCKTMQDIIKKSETEEKHYSSHNGCGVIQPRRYFTKDLKVYLEFKESDDISGDRKREMTAKDVIEIFDKISDSDAKAIGFNPNRARPADMILQVIPIAPLCVRPSVAMDNVNRQEDDLTFQYRNIVKTNIELQSQIDKGAPQTVIKDACTVLQFYLATLINNEIPGQPTSRQKSGKSIKAIKSRLKGKEGRIRGNLMGKRVDFSARSVISPDPNLELDQLGVPRSIAMILTFPEIVSVHNIVEMRKLVENGPDKWPGANYILQNDGKMIGLQYTKKRTDTHLESGYIVMRHLKDDDLVLFNRQPSLHKMSIMGHRVKVLPYSSFRLNLSVTTPYNADFDGDEMNMHVPQSYETKSEIANIIHVPRQIISPQSNKPVMGIVQDSLVGMKLITSKDTFIEIEVAMDLMTWIKKPNNKFPTPAILKPRPLWTGKQFVSLILPEINLTKPSSTYDKNFKFDTPINITDTKVLIEKGRLLMGALCKRTVGSAPQGIIQIIFNDFGFMECKNFMSNAQTIVNNWLLTRGFGIGVSDTIADKGTLSAIREALINAKEEVKKIVDQAQRNSLEKQPGKNILESFESRVNEQLNKAREDAGQLALKSIDERNNIKQTVTSGSKGTETNITQIMSCLGQQNVEGKRIPFGFLQRTLPHFLKDDFGPESKGFVENSYLAGLTAQEFYFHAMGGREGLIDTAVKTSETGYIQRRLMKALEDVMVRYDGTVRNSLGSIIQFLYGEDGMAGEMVEDQSIVLLNQNDKDMKKKYRMLNPSKTNTEKLSKLKKYLEYPIAEDMANNQIYQDRLEKHYQELVTLRQELRTIFKGNDDPQRLPIHIQRMIWNIKKLNNLSNNRISDLHPIEVLDSLENLISNLKIVKKEDAVSKEIQNSSKLLLIVSIKTELSPKQLIFRERFTKDAFNILIGEIERKFDQSISNPGEMVGSIAAQSIGEPATQMTLNTFHFAGVSAKNVTLGVPRLKEIINVTKKMKTPSMTIYLQEQYSRSMEKTKEFLSKLEYTNLSDVTQNTEIVYDPNIHNTRVEEDKELVSTFYEFPDECDFDETKLSHYVLRIVLDNNKLEDKKLIMIDIKNLIQSEKFQVIVSDQNANLKVIRIRQIRSTATMIEEEDADSVEDMKLIQNRILNDYLIRGIPEIKKVYFKETKMVGLYNNNGDPIKNKNEWVLETDGSNLASVIHVEGIDHTRLYTNNVLEILEVLGIEACRNALLKELRSVLKPYSIYVNYRHLAVLIDFMTQKGHLTSITRHGINRLDIGPLRKCSFEETVETLLEAGLFAETDFLKGITENIMTGQLCPLGTGCFDIVLDLPALKNAKDVIQPIGNAIDLTEDFLMSSSRGELQSNSQTPVYGGTPSQYSSGMLGEAISSPMFSPLPQKGFNSPIHPITSGNYKPFSPTIQSPLQSPIIQSPLIYNAGFRKDGKTVAINEALNVIYNSPLAERNSGGLGGARQGAISSPLYSPIRKYNNILSPNYSPSGGDSRSINNPNQSISKNSGILSPTLGPGPSIMSPLYNRNMLSPNYEQNSNFQSPAYKPTVSDAIAKPIEENSPERSDDEL